MAAAVRKDKAGELSATQIHALEMTTRERALFAALRLRMAGDARKKLVPFTCLTMPDPSNVNDPRLSKYKPAKHHHAIAAVLERALALDIKRLIINAPPRHGKSELSSRRFPAMVLGHHPDWEVIFGTYNDTIALDFGDDVREIVRSQSYRQIFPDTTLRKGQQAKEKIETTKGGAAFFVGRGSSLTSRGADILIIDDPLKGRKEANSALIRDELWKWFNDDALSRLKNENCVVIIIQTRWHEDDLVGRLTDPNNPHFDPEEAKQWTILDLPALAFDHEPDALGRKAGEALWPERFGAEFLRQIKRRNPSGFASLYQGRPAPDEGNFFKAEHLVEYGPADLPPRSRLRFYAASDHAVSTKQENDRTCLGAVGVDELGDIWIMPDLQWGRFPSATRRPTRSSSA
jgi:hypothetical protein